MTPDLTSLPEPARSAMTTALEAPLGEWRTVQRDLDSALEAVNWPTLPAPVPLAEDLSPVQRTIAVLLANRPGTYVPARFAMPISQWNRRRWLGLDPPSTLESRVTHEGETAFLWQHALKRQKDADAMVTLLSTLSPPQRFEALLDLLLNAYRFSTRIMGALPTAP